jgi:hypothetical protein
MNNLCHVSGPVYAGLKKCEYADNIIDYEILTVCRFSAKEENK